MTNLEALRARLGYPLDDNALEIALIRRSLVKDDLYIASTSEQNFDLAYADAICTVLTSPTSLSEGGYSISMSDKKLLQDTANYFYKKYNVASPIEDTKPIATFRQPW